MSIYAITKDGFKYQELDLQVNDFLDYFPEEFSYQEANRFDQLNLSLGSFWPSLKTVLRNIKQSDNVTPDITTWRETTLVLSPHAYRYTVDLLKTYGELLPVIIDEETWYIFNCTTTAEVDSARTNENNIAFDKHSVGNKALFKCLYPYGLGLYCNDRFKKLIDDYGLKGINFVTSQGEIFPQFKQSIS